MELREEYENTSYTSSEFPLFMMKREGKKKSITREKILRDLKKLSERKKWILTSSVKVLLIFRSVNIVLKTPFSQHRLISRRH